MSAEGTPREGYLRILETRPTIGDRFTGLSRLGGDGGGGHFSLMFTATDNTMGTTVALKFFNPERAGDSYRLDSFRREAELLSELADPRYLVELVAPRSEFPIVLTAEGNIMVPVLFTYYGMRLANGSVLGRIARGPLDASEAIEIFGQVCRAVQYLHRKGTVHRDLKPENFLVFPRNEVRLADLGAARRLSDSPLLPTYAGMPPGDKRYTAPELIASLHDDDPAIAIGADFFALGAILYELLTGSVLTLQVFEQRFLMRLLSNMAAVPASKRRGVYDGIVRSIVDGHPLPSLVASPRPIPGSVASRLDALYRGLADIDYHSRLTSFSSVFRQIDICRIVLKNEEKYQRWREERRRRRNSVGR